MGILRSTRKTNVNLILIIMLKHLRSVGMLLFLASMYGGVANAVPVKDVAGVENIQQNGTASGVVKDALGETVIGASVIVKGTTNGTITDFDGNFSLAGVKKGDIIQISFVGYQTQEVVWQGQPLNVVLQDDTQALEEVVVVGFGTQKKVNLTGAVSTVDSKAIAARPVNSVVDALQGAVAGMNFSTLVPETPRLAPAQFPNLGYLTTEPSGATPGVNSLSDKT